MEGNFTMKAIAMLAALGALSALAYAESEPHGFYTNLSGGAYRIEADGFHDTAPMIKVLGGYDINQYLGFETGYAQLLESTDRVSGDRVKIDGNVWDLSTKLSYPLTDKFSGYGRIGWSFYEFDGKVKSEGSSVKEHDDNDDLSWALGANYALTDRLGLRGEYSTIDIHRVDTDLVTVGLTYRLGAW